MTNYPTIIPVYAAFLSFFYLFLSIRVIINRRTKLIGLGHGEDKDTLKKVRTHANFSEYIPLTLLLLFICEVQDAPSWLLHTLGGLLIFSRAIHAIGIKSSIGYSFGRFYGTAITYLVMMTCSIRMILVAWDHL